MAIKDYTQLITQLADNITNDISPIDVREIVETLSTKYLVATFQSGAAINTTGGIWATFPADMVAYPSAKTNGISLDNVTKKITLRDPGLYIVIYRAGGTLTQGVFRMKLRYNPDGVPVDAPLSLVRAETPGTDEFVLTGTQLILAPVGNQTIDVQYQTAANETWFPADGFVVVISLPVKYGGA